MGFYALMPVFPCRKKTAPRKDDGMETRTRSLTEGGILAAVMVVLAVAAVYVPLLGILAVLLWPLPAAILIVRHGLLSLPWG